MINVSLKSSAENEINQTEVRTTRWKVFLAFVNAIARKTGDA